MEQSGTQKWCEAQMDKYSNETHALIQKLPLPTATTKDLTAINAYLNTRIF